MGHPTLQGLSEGVGLSSLRHIYITDLYQRDASKAEGGEGYAFGRHAEDLRRHEEQWEEDLLIICGRIMNV
jgi:hypothetical protein